MNAVVFSDLRNSITFSDFPDASGHYIQDCTFTNCGLIDPGRTNFTNNTISSPTPSGTGGFYLDQSTAEAGLMSDLTFNSAGQGHAIYIAESGYYTFTNFDYNDYGATGSFDAAVLNDCGGPVTINISGGESPTYRNGAAGSSTTLVQNVTITVTVIDEAGDPVQNAQVALYVGANQVMNEDTTALGIATEDYGGSTPVSATLRIRKGSSADSPKYLPVSSTQTIGSDGLTVTITLIEDTNNNS
jgi:hypothetical protein